MIAHNVDILFGQQKSKFDEGVEVYERFYKRTYGKDCCLQGCQKHRIDNTT